jgi:hypothetical protein
MKIGRGNIKILWYFFGFGNETGVNNGRLASPEIFSK